MTIEEKAYDEAIRKELIQFIKNWKDPNNIGRPHDFPTLTRNVEQCDRYIAWLEKQASVGEIVSRCKTSWYNEGKIQGQIEGLSDEEKYQQGWHDALEKQGEQKPYDQRKECKDCQFNYASECKGYCALKRDEQKPADWSEEDETRLTNIIIMLKEGASHHFIKDDITKAVDWLKSLRPQNHWKPTEEQVEAFEHFVRSIGESGYASPYENNTKLLYSLLNDLEKLIE